MQGDLAARLAATDPRLLLPAVGMAEPPDRLELLGALRLPAAGPVLHLAVARDADGACHTLPLVDDGALRRARAGDGFAVAVTDLIGGGQAAEGFQVRRSPGSLDLGGAVAEESLGVEHGREAVGVGANLRVALWLSPSASGATTPDVLAHLREVGFGQLLTDLGDVAFAGPPVLAPTVALAARPAGPPVAETLTWAAAGHLRGRDDPETTLAPVREVAALTADLHLALATASRLMAEPVRGASDADTTGWRRAITDGVTEATVLAGGEVAEAVKRGRPTVRAALDVVTGSVGTPTLPAAGVRGLDAVWSVQGGGWCLAPEDLMSVGGAGSRSPAHDLAVLVRGLDHVVRGVQRRLVGAGDSAPAERVASWSEAVREELIDTYRARLAAGGRADLFDERLLLAFEIQAECEALIFAARRLSTWQGVPIGGLVEVLTRPR